MRWIEYMRFIVLFRAVRQPHYGTGIDFLQLQKAKVLDLRFSVEFTAPSFHRVRLSQRHGSMR